MLNLSLSRSHSSRSPTRTITSTTSSSSSSSRLSIFPGLRRSYGSDLKRDSFDSYQHTLASTSLNYAEDMDDENVAWGPVSRKKYL